MIRIGLTGGIASGKSTISKIILEQSIPIIDCDIIAKEVLEVYPQILLQIKNEFGNEFIDKNGKLKRKVFGNFIFKNSNKRDQYESIILPYIKKRIFEKIKEYEDQGVDICIIDAPILIETGLHNEMDKVILVWIDIDTQINRIIKRDNFTKQQAIDRIESQMLIDKKLKYANYVIKNTGTIDFTRNQVFETIKIIKKIYNIN